MFPPNWGDGISESLEWYTDKLSSEVWAEQRISRRLTPRRSFQATFLLEGRERQRFTSAMAGKGADVWLIPLWHEVAALQASAGVGTDTLSVDTRWREYAVDGLVILRGANSARYEVGTIEAKTDSTLQLISDLEASWPAGTKVYPALLARIQYDAEEIKRTDRLSSARITFRVERQTRHSTTFYPSEYRGAVVYDQRPDDSTELGVGYTRQLLTLDDGLSLPLYQDLPGHQRTTQAYSWAFQGREAAYRHRQLLHYLRGSAVGVWVPTFMDDVVVTDDIAKFDTELLVENFGYSEFGARQPGRMDLYIELKSGVKFYRRILDSEIVDSERERLYLDAPLFRAVSTDDILRISFLQFARLGEDQINIEHPTDTDGISISTVQWVTAIDPADTYYQSASYGD